MCGSVTDKDLSLSDVDVKAATSESGINRRVAQSRGGIGSVVVVGGGCREGIVRQQMGASWEGETKMMTTTPNQCGSQM